MKTIKDRLLKGGASMMALRGYSIVLMLVLMGCLTRWMSPPEVASYMAGMNLLIFISLVSMGGLNQSMLRLVAGKKSKSASPKELLWRCWRSALLMSASITLLFSVLLYTALGDWLTIERAIIPGLLVCGFLLMAHKLLATSLRSVHAIASSSILEGRSGGPLANTAYFPIVALFSLTTLTATKSFWGLAIALGLTLPLGIWMLLKAADAAVREKENKAKEATNIEDDEHEQGAETDNVLLFSLPFLTIQVLIYFATEFDVLIAKAYASDDATAIFSTDRRLILQMLAPLQVITASVGGTIAELYAKNDRVNLERTLRYSSTVASLLTVPLLGICMLFPGPILGAIFGSFYNNVEGAMVFRILAVGQIAVTLTGQCGPLMLMSGRTSVMIMIRSVAALAMIFVGSWATIQFGIRGLAVASAAILIGQNLAVWLLARYLVGLWTHPALSLKRPPKVKRGKKQSVEPDMAEEKSEPTS